MGVRDWSKAALYEEIQALRKDVLQRDARIAELEAKLQDARDHVAEMDGNVQALQDGNRDCRARIAELELTRRPPHGDVMTYSTTFWQKGYEERDARIAELEAQVRMANEERDGVVNRIADLEALLREVSPSCSMYLRERIEAALTPDE